MHILVLGASGKMGRAISEVLGNKNHTSTALVRCKQKGNALELERVLGESFAAADADMQGQFIIDVSLPEGTLLLCEELLRCNPNLLQKLNGLVIGTTGHNPSVLEQIQKVAKLIPVVLASNFSKGVFLFEELLRAQTRSGLTVAALARSLGFELGLVESHHNKKKDAPSGTAITLAKAADIPENEISSIRLGSIVGEHTLIASAESEEIKITHTAQTRKLFALGAVSLLEKMSKIQPSANLYTFRDIFNFSETTPGSIAK